MVKENLERILYNGIWYYYRYQLAYNGDRCLATKDPKKYMNGFYKYSDKDPGSGKAFVVIKEWSIERDCNT